MPASPVNSLLDQLRTLATYGVPHKVSGSCFDYGYQNYIPRHYIVPILLHYLCSILLSLEGLAFIQAISKAYEEGSKHAE